jgi:serine/threonine protein kinase
MAFRRFDSQERSAYNRALTREHQQDMGPSTPNKLGRYEIVDEIGKGAMGIVYLARDPLIGRLVALKTFRIGYSVKDQDAEQFRIRFLREAQSAGILTHPNIVTIHDVVESSDDGLAFIAMEYVRGTNLKLVLQGEKLVTAQFVLDVMSHVGDALDYAHAHRVIHRDVKPANILITDDGRMKITDFGIARLDTSNLTQEGQLLGTPNYMAPEQIQGKEVDHRADLFSLGVVLYEMLTRHKPFQGENLTVVSHRIVYDPFTPPREYARELPLGVEQILNRALDKDPARRFQRARDLVEDLRQAFGGSRAVAPLPFVLPPAPPPASTDPAFNALNDTQSLSVTVVHPPAEVQLSDSTFSSASTSIPPPPLLPPPPLPVLEDSAASLAVPAAVRPRAPGAKGGAGRWLALTGALVLAAVVAGAGFKLWQGWSQASPPAELAPAISIQARLDALVQDAQRQLGRGDYAGAVGTLRKAEALAPENTVIRDMRQGSERSVELLAKARTQAETLEAQLELGRQALAAKRFTEAATAAMAALQLSPGQTEATELLAKAQAAQAAARKRQQKPAPATAGIPATVATLPAPGPAEPVPIDTSGESKEATLVVSLFSQFPRGSMMVYVNGRRVLQEQLRFVERGGLFRSKTAPGELSRSLTVQPGTSEVRLYVTPEGKKAQVRTFTGNFPGGSSRTLEIRLSEAGDVTANLN